METSPFSSLPKSLKGRASEFATLKLLYWILRKWKTCSHVWFSQNIPLTDLINEGTDEFQPGAWKCQLQPGFKQKCLSENETLCLLSIKRAFELDDIFLDFFSIWICVWFQSKLLGSFWPKPDYKVMIDRVHVAKSTTQMKLVPLFSDSILKTME